MRSTIAISAAIATFATSAFAANCNPSYNTPGSTECFTACNVVCILLKFVYVVLCTDLSYRKLVKSGFLAGPWTTPLSSF